MNLVPKSVAIVSVVLLCVFLFAACTLTRAGYKSPEFSVLAGIGRMEIREYPALLLAQTPSSHATQGGDGSFMRLFRFISKGNSSESALEMTTPVLFRGEKDREAMAFVLPKGLSKESAPAPKDAAVTLETRPAGTYAVLRMSGSSLTARETATRELLSILRDSSWEPEGDPEFAFYDPPWIPSFLKKNEIHCRIRAKGGAGHGLP